MKRKMMIFLFICISLYACSNSDDKVHSLTKNIQVIEENKIFFDCSEEVSKASDNSGDRDSIGYLCSVIINEGTKMRSQESGGTLEATDFAVGDSVSIQFSKGQRISDKNREFEAKEVTLLD